MPKENPQDKLLNELRKQKIPCVIHLTNGYQLKNVLLRAFDNFVIVILTEEQAQMLIYKHAISSITIAKPIPLEPAASPLKEEEGCAQK